MSTLLESVAGFATGGDLTSVLKLATTGMSAIGGIQQSRAEAAAIKATGKQELQRAEWEAERLKREKAIMTGRQRALYAKGGVEISSGSPLEVITETAGEYELDIAQTMATGKAAYSLAKKQAKGVQQAGWFTAGPTILSGVSEFAESPLMKRVLK